MHKVIIVGAGFAGLQAVKGLTIPSLEVTIIDKQNYHLFQPLLYQVATAGLSHADIALPIRNIFRSQNNINIILDELIEISPQLNHIKTRNNENFYEYYCDEKINTKKKYILISNLGYNFFRIILF